MIRHRFWAAVIAGSLSASTVSADECLRGFNLSGAEFGTIPGRANFDYGYPSAEAFARAAAEGATAIRLPVRWERLQPALDRPLDAAELTRLDAALAAASAVNLHVVLDLHNFGRYDERRLGSETLPASALADLWTRLAARYGRDERVVLSLMNEPYDIPGRDWAAAANAAILAIRGTGARNLVLVSGTAWSGAHSWTQDLPTGNNGRDMLAVHDPLGRFAFDVHQYLDADYSGRSGECSGAGGAIAGITSVDAWLVANGRKGFLGEFASSPDPACLAALRQMVTRIDADPGHWIGWTAWGAGAWWPPGYVFRIDLASARADPQLAVLAPLWRRPDGKPATCNSSDHR